MASAIWKAVPKKWITEAQNCSKLFKKWPFLYVSYLSILPLTRAGPILFLSSLWPRFHFIHGVSVLCEVGGVGQPPRQGYWEAKDESDDLTRQEMCWTHRIHFIWIRVYSNTNLLLAEGFSGSLEAPIGYLVRVQDFDGLRACNEPPSGSGEKGIDWPQPEDFFLWHLQEEGGPDWEAKGRFCCFQIVQ